ncbi:MAG: DUF58 domain-containing protein [Chloroflexota bacterium]
MLTVRARMFLAAAGVFYLFANQTQVGWLYVMSALLAGTVLAGCWLSRGTLRHIAGERQVGSNADAEVYEGDDVNIDLTIRQDGRSSAAQLRLNESCPLAAPESKQHSMAIFIPTLPANSAVKFDYSVSLYRRGVHDFPAVKLASRAPFGFFQQRRELPISTRVLVFPEVRPLHHLDLLDRQLSPQLPRPRAGTGYEVMGVRPFRNGDSPRHIHWRSVARTGQLVSKEFADEAQPGLSLVLDLFQHPYPVTDSKHVPFEWAVKCAASIGEYARLKGYPLHIVADDDVLAAPVGAVSRWALLQYLARVQPTGIATLPRVLGRQALQTFAAVILPWPDRAIVEPLLELHRRRVEVLAVVIDPQTFPSGGLSTPSAAPLVDELRALGIETCYIRFTQDGEDWAQQLSEGALERVH